MVKIEIPFLIRDYIKENGLSKMHIAKKANIEKSRFSRIINGQSQMNMEEYQSICKAINVPSSYFFGETISINEKGE